MAARMHGISEAILKSKLDREIARTEDHIAQVTKSKKRPHEDTDNPSKIKVLTNNGGIPSKAGYYG